MIRTRRSLILTVWFALLAISAGVVAARFQLRTDLSVFLPPAHTAAQEVLLDQIRQGPTTRIVLAAIEGAEPEALARASAALARRLRADPAIASVINGPQSLSGHEREFWFRNRYLLSPSDPSGDWKTPQLRTVLTGALARLASSFGMIERNFIARDPTGEWQRLIGSQESDHRIALRHGVWFSSSGKRALLLIRTKASAFDLDAQQRALDSVRRDYAVGAAPRMRLILSGPGVFAVASRETIQADAWRLSLLGNVAVVVLLLYVFGSLRPVLLGLLPLLTGVLAGTAAVVATYGFIHGITLAFGVTLTGIVIDYPLHLLMHRQPNEHPVTTMTRIWPTLRLGILTTTIGYAALLLADIQGLAQLGLLSTVAIVVAGLTTRWVLPLLVGPVAVQVAPSRHNRTPPARLVASARVLVVLMIGFAAAYLFWLAPNFWQNDLAALSPIPQSALKADRELRADLGAADPRHVMVVTGKSAQAVLERCEAVIPLLEAARRQHLLASYDAPCLQLPSVAAQRRRQAQIPDAPTLRARLRQASRGLPFRAGLFEPFVTDLETTKSRPPITPSELHGTVLGARLDSMLFAQGSRWFGTIPLHRVTDSAALARRVDADGESLFYLDLKRESEGMVAGFRNRALVLWGFGLLGIVVVLSLGLRSPVAALRLLVPVAAGVILVCAILLITGHPISLFHLVALLLVVGLGLDYLLFFSRAHMDEEERRRSARAIWLCAVTTIIAFGVLALSRIPVLAAIGSTVALGSIVSFALAALFAPVRRDAPR